ncbi:helix-turn-helix domain-containing protein [Pseudomonas migulae]|uniref:Helix-turn-helix domain-containing protein n=1 Tax=Pseudomonas migulae TaxID=78543 RepID=A0ABY8MU06_9PSED|nr:helix-turn-helix domain-containing protein [Pseudomonas migulae]WGK90835.1 helix-turn-helix domain-containing protein [Pseudomonas migulae]
MARKTAALLPSIARLLIGLGERLKLARLRRRLTAKQVAEQAGMSVMTLRSLESGGSGVTIGAYLSVMHVLGLEQDLNTIAAIDDQGQKRQDAQLIRVMKPRANKSLHVKSTTASKSSGPQTKNVVGLSNASESKLHPFPINTQSLSALLTRKKTPEPNAQ